MSPYCSDCGAQVRQMDSYCWQCGSELEFGDTGSASTRREDPSGAAEQREEAAEDDGGSAFSFGDTGDTAEDSSRDTVAEAEGYVGGDGEERGGETDRDIYDSGGEDRHSYGEEDESRHYAEEPEPRDPEGSTFGDDAREEHDEGSIQASETSSLDSEIQRIDETPGSQQEVDRSEPPWKGTDSKDQASGSVSEDRPRYVQQESEEDDEGKITPQTGSGSTATVKLGLSLAVAGAVVAALAHDQVRGITALAPVVRGLLPPVLSEDPGLMTRVRSAGAILAALGVVVAAIGRYRS